MRGKRGTSPDQERGKEDPTKERREVKNGKQTTEGQKIRARRRQEQSGLIWKNRNSRNRHRARTQRKDSKRKWRRGTCETDQKRRQKRKERQDQTQPEQKAWITKDDFEYDDATALLEKTHVGNCVRGWGLRLHNRSKRTRKTMWGRAPTRKKWA